MSDLDARRQAVDPGHSVIVQAPAGSGKTTLLVERYLGLLAAVDAPEEILAITFTRKAAAEMRQRVLHYLDPDFDSDEAHEQGPLRKARAVRARVAAWGLRENPQRMLIRTIDSFNHFLARTMPVASALGPVPAPADNVQALYRQAARNVLKLVDQDTPFAEDLQCLLGWRDHRSQDIENLLTDLMGKREQWLRALHLNGELQRAHLESVLHAVVTEQLAQAASSLRDTLARTGIDANEVLTLARFAATTLQGTNRQSDIRSLIDAHRLPDAAADAIPLWRGLGALFLTTGNEYRKSVTVSQGFPPNADEKTRFKNLLGNLNDDLSFRFHLAKARSLPPPRYDDAEWAVLDALVRVLVRSAAELNLLFARVGQIDYMGLADAALQGLGDEDTGYSDLGLYLDRQIRHLLVDEFQDTNWGQLHLLEKLTAGWEQGDGRSLFMVGDPMQSIYRFREADVGLFMRSRDQGVGAVRVESVRLTTNFRSRVEVVDWVNQRLGPIFPAREDISGGAVAYARSEAGRDTGGQIDTLAFAEDAAEGKAIAELVQRVLQEHADDANFKAAIIVRARSHLADILPALDARRIPYRAVKLDPLNSKPVVQDLLAITRAIMLPGDVTALLAVLRSPVCGLSLEALTRLGGDGRSIFDQQALRRLDTDSKQRAQRVFEVLENARAHWQRRPVRDLVEGAWTSLGGPQCCKKPTTDMRDASVYLDALEQAEASGLLDDWNDFAELLDAQHTEGDPPSDDVKLDILTMHGAKGLEWDLVILPGLNKRPPAGESTLLHWLPFTAATGQEQVLMAPLRAAEELKNTPLIELIRNEQKLRSSYENQRLLYVATTRAKDHLVMSASLDASKEEVKPITGSLLADLWETTADDFLASIAATGPSATTDAPGQERDQSLRRIAKDWRPMLEPRLDWQPALPPKEPDWELEFNWAGVQARRTGTVMHRLLERVGQLGIENLTDDLRATLIARIPFLLRSMGTRRQALDGATGIVRQAFEQTLESATGRWVLSNAHAHAACELAISGTLNGQLVNAIVDRTFVDDQGTRWVIDYKSGYHAGADLQGFLAQESERYEAQLARYQSLFEQLETRTVKTALYLPRHCVLQEVGNNPVR